MTFQFGDAKMPGPLFPVWTKLKSRYPELKDKKYGGGARMDTAVILYDATCKLIAPWQKKRDQIDKDHVSVKYRFTEWLNLNNGYRSQMDSAVKKFNDGVGETIQSASGSRLKAGRSVAVMTDFVKVRKDLMDKMQKNDEASAKELTSLMNDYDKDMESIQSELNGIVSEFRIIWDEMQSTMGEYGKTAKQSKDAKVLSALAEFGKVVDQARI